MRKLSIEDVYKKAALNGMDFKTTNEINPLDDDILKQEKAKETIRFGLSVNKFGYNLFVSGSPTSRRKTFLKKVLEEFSSKKGSPKDQVYVHNFDEENSPILFTLPAGKGKEFEERTEVLKEKLTKDVPSYFSSDEYQKQNEMILQSYDVVFEELYESYNVKFAELSYKLIQAEEGFVPAPISESGKVLLQEEYEALTKDEKNTYLENKKQVELLMIEMGYLENKIEEKRKDELSKIEKTIVKEMIKKPLSSIKQVANAENKHRMKKYVENMEKHILNNIEKFKPQEQPKTVNIMQLFAGVPSGSAGAELEKYSVNVIVDSSKQTKAPVLFLEKFDPAKLLGTINYSSYGQQLFTNHMLITGGELLKANGGYVVIDVKDLFKHEGLWYDFKEVLMQKELEIESKMIKTALASAQLEPEAIPFDAKIILVGDYYWYNLLMQNDPEFNSLFKIHALFEYQTERTEESEVEYVRFLTRYIQNQNLKAFTKEAVQKVVEYSSRQTDNQDKLLLTYFEVYRLLDEADAWAEMLGKEYVDLESVEKSLEQMDSIKELHVQRYGEQVKNGVWLIDTEGEKVGQINALTVMDFGDYRIGQPAKVTATTYRGAEGVISVDRSVKQTGPIHDKGVEIIKGYLGSQFANEYPISLNASVSFEQLYNGLEGDSATSTELYAILSDLSGKAINQSFGITGSMDQKGNVQAIGGVNEKIEGFFATCKTKGLTGSQGVIIPKANINDLMLSKEVRDAVESDTFSIYAVEHVDEGIKILTGYSMEEIQRNIKERLENIRKLNTEKN